MSWSTRRKKVTGDKTGEREEWREGDKARTR